MKKIAILVPDLCLGGGQRVAINTAHLLVETYEVHIVIFSNDNQLFETDIKVINLHITKKKSFLGKLINIFRRARAYKKILAQEKYDFTISFLESANLCAFLCCRKKTILTIHARPDLLPMFDQLILRHLFKFSKNIVVVSEGLKKAIEKDYKIRNITVINNSIDYGMVKIQADKEKFHHSRKFMLAAGRLSSEKRFDLMIELYYQTKASQEFDLIILGDGEELDLLKSKSIINHGHVQFLGGTQNIFPIMKEAELFLMTSRLEAFPMVLLESLALGTPVIAFDCPTGLGEIVLNDKNGILIENNNSFAFVKEIDNVLFDNKLKNKLIENSTLSVVKYHPDHIRKHWDKYFDERFDSKVLVE